MNYMWKLKPTKKFLLRVYSLYSDSIFSSIYLSNQCYTDPFLKSAGQWIACNSGG